MVRGDSSIWRAGWHFGLVAGLFLAVFSAYPQLKLLYNEGGEWNGHYAYNDIDEVAYASYLKALIDGRPRRNDPYTGRDDTPGKPQPESLFSVQFAAPYAVAVPARALGISAPTAMTAAGIIAAFLSAFLCFLLIREITGSRWAGLAGSLIVLCGGALAAGEGAIGEILGTGFSYPYFPFLRRYVPAVPFPAFIGLLLCVLYLLRTKAPGRRAVYCAAAAGAFSFLVFSYFYIWTTAAAWLACLGLVWIVFRPEGWRRDVLGLVILGVSCIIPLAAYAMMLAGRAESLDQVQLLVHTRSPDLWRFPIYISFASLVIYLAGVAARRIEPRRTASLFTLSLCVVPIVLFNQQIVTGRSLQPIHYQVFIGNYVAALALVLTGFLFFGRSGVQTGYLRKAVCASLATIAAVWGFIECHYTVRVLDEANLIRDRQVPAAERLVEYGKKTPDPHRTTIFSISNLHADDSPTLAPQSVLWSRHQHVFAGLTWQESKERYYRYLYYQSLDQNWLKNRLRNGDFVSMIALFGWGRHSDRLSSQAKPLTETEIAEEAARYGEFIQGFGKEDAADPLLSYAVIPDGWDPDLTNLRRWYALEEMERAGGLAIYKLSLLDTR